MADEKNEGGYHPGGEWGDYPTFQDQLEECWEDDGDLYDEIVGFPNEEILRSYVWALDKIFSPKWGEDE